MSRPEHRPRPLASRASSLVRRCFSRPAVRWVWASAGVLLVAALVWPVGGPAPLAAGAVSAAAATAAAVPAQAAATGAAVWNLPRKRLDRPGAQQVAADMAPMVFSYVVQQGDTLTAIARRFATSVGSLEKINSLNDQSLLQVGQRITVLRRVGWLYKVRAGDSVDAIAQRVGVGVNELEAANNLVGANPVLLPGETLIVPKAPPTVQGVTAGTAAAPVQVAPPSGQALIWPVHGPITSPFGWRLNPWGGDGWFFHHGIDIGVPSGTPVAAACSGQVVLAAWDGGYGNAVEIQCAGAGPLTLYAHNEALEVQAGQAVQQGQLISYSGMTGNATGPHVHFGVMVNGVWRNPIDYLPPQ